MAKINNFQGDPTNVQAKKASLVSTTVLQAHVQKEHSCAH